MESQKRDRHWLDSNGPKFQEDEEFFIQEKLLSLDEQATEEQKELETKKARAEFYAWTLAGLQTWSDTPP